MRRRRGGLLDAPQAFPPQGGRWPDGPDEGADERDITPVGTLISLALLDSFPLKGGSHYWTRNVRPYGTASSPDGLIRLAALGTFP